MDNKKLICLSSKWSRTRRRRGYTPKNQCPPRLDWRRWSLRSLSPSFSILPPFRYTCFVIVTREQNGEVRKPKVNFMFFLNKYMWCFNLPPGGGVVTCKWASMRTKNYFSSCSSFYKKKQNNKNQIKRALDTQIVLLSNLTFFVYWNNDTLINISVMH